MPVMCLAFSHLHRTRETLYHAIMRTTELTPKQILSVRCPTCGAATGDSSCKLRHWYPALGRSPRRETRKLFVQTDAVENGDVSQSSR